MGTIFVAYGGEGRESVLEFAAERAAASGDDLYVYHAQESADEDAADVRAEIDGAMERATPDVAYEVEIEIRGTGSDAANVSNQKRLLDTIFESDRAFAYVVMGEVEHGAIESLTLPSMTEAVLETHDVPVLLVPV